MNAHIRGWYTETTNANGKMVEHILRRYALDIVSPREPTFCRPGRMSCIDYILMDKRTQESLLETRIADKLCTGSDHFMLVAHFKKNVLTLQNN